MAETLSSTTVSTKLERIAKLAREVPQAALTTLAHHIDIDWLREAYRRTRKNGATGVDRQTAAEYASNLESNLRSLLQRAKSGSYVAPPVRRVHIPKGEGSQTRPIGIPTFEDKVLQRAVAMVLEAVYEQSFLDCSYGFRPGRSAHQALRLVQNQTVKMAGKWVLEIDIRKFFDSLDHSQLRNIVRKRVRDGVLLRLIGKWLNAGVMEDGALEYPEAGTPQGGVISPLLANIYLHEVLDEWFARQVAPRLGGRAVLVRYADDVVIIFEQEQDARRVIDVLPKRLAKYGLMLHPEKTRLVDFRRPDRRDSALSDNGEARSRTGTFDLLGFTHYWAMSRKGYWVVKQKTAADRFRRALKRIADWCRRYRHEPVREQWTALTRKLLGHFEYFAVIGNLRALRKLRQRGIVVWRKWLSRRSQRAWISWEEMNRLLERYPLPQPRIRSSTCHVVKP
ncbi:MAG TPA: group II intron reverse transcriptase/maturase [Candidatus Binataceae bacterium]|jgi:RNA-directed DNA polymerase|nr:group II intron reverse transcriptase/maturase [Candidatus Binataceae bacterium]